jgi:hypothetical protein
MVRDSLDKKPSLSGFDNLVRCGKLEELGAWLEGSTLADWTGQW